jgi:hypothetical protein
MVLVSELDIVRQRFQFRKRIWLRKGLRNGLRLGSTREFKAAPTTWRFLDVVSCLLALVWLEGSEHCIGESIFIETQFGTFCDGYGQCV